MRVAVGISGGVDSAVAAWLLKQEGHDVLGLFMKNWEDDDDEIHCAAAEDLEYAEAVCRHIGIPLRTVNFASEYWDRIFEVFLDEYRKGRTPNPDVLCNREIKFKLFAEHTRTLAADKIATGHYAGVECVNSEWHLLKGHDADKDQSYFLHLLTPDVLAQTLFPLAGLDKRTVRHLARCEGLASCDRKDSTGICFIGERHFRDFLARYISGEPGEIIDEAGLVVGTHQGIWSYTIGQRAGVGGVRGEAEGAWYVAAKDIERNRLMAVQGRDHPTLFSSTLVASNVHWINQPLLDRAALAAKVRYRQVDQVCRLSSCDNACVEVRFEQPQRAVAPGQSVVFYDGQCCLGGGVIESAGGFEMGLRA